MEAVTDNVVKEYVVTLLLKDKNALSQICAERTAVGGSLKAAALNDIEQLMQNPQLDADWLRGYTPSAGRRLSFPEYQRSLEAIVAAGGYEETLEKLMAHYAAFGDGENAKYIAFKWRGGLQGVKTPDRVDLNLLFCIEDQKQILVNNTKAFVRGLPANNVLLYGNSGCGKSSLVKAMLRDYYKDGLRLVQILKEDLAQLPLLIEQIRDRQFFYIVFIDDLSFENDDLGYKALKTALDGSIEKQPGNIVYYATSNRFHLINERWSERQSNDVHARDTMNEKLSLSERFGIRISFNPLDQREYLQIIEGILAREGIPVTEEIQKAALHWAMCYNGRSGRTAVQYINAFFSNRAGLSIY